MIVRPGLLWIAAETDLDDQAITCRNRHLASVCGERPIDKAGRQFGRVPCEGEQRLECRSVPTPYRYRGEEIVLGVGLRCAYLEFDSLDGDRLRFQRI